MADWNMISEVELLDMLAQYYESRDYSVDYIHNKRELGVDLVCRKDEEVVVVLAKVTPGQEDLGQPPLAKQNYSSATKYIYYYAGEPSAPFVSVMTSNFPEFELCNQEAMEERMLAADNIYMFRFLVKYSPAITKIASLLQRIYTSRKAAASEISADEDVFQRALEAHEGIIQMRELDEMALVSLQRLLDEYPDFRENGSQEKELIEKMKSTILDYTSRMNSVSEKLGKLSGMSDEFLQRFYQGGSIWGTTYNAAWLPNDLDGSDWGRYGRTKDKKHFFKILDFMVCAFREYEHFNYGVLEAWGCFSELRHIFQCLKKASETSLLKMFSGRT